MDCPMDGTPLVTEIYETDIEVDVCPRCGGMWLDKGELEAIQQTVERDYSEALLSVPDTVKASQRASKQMSRPMLSCPGCKQEMSRKEYGYGSQVVIDLCAACGGIWLDRGELEELEVFFERTKLKYSDARRGFLGSLFGFFQGG